MKPIYLLYIFLGSGMGGVLRWLLAQYLPKFGSFPIATWAANVLAAGILGAVMAAFQWQTIAEKERLLWGVGFCGGLSTFSTFAYELWQLWHNNDIYVFVVYIIVSIFGCLLAVACGYALWAYK